MVKLYDIIEELSKEESRNVSIFLNRTNASKDRKDQYLFDFARKNQGDVNEQEVLTKLYGKGASKNSLYRLKNRLLGDINKSLVQLYFDKNEYNVTLHLFALAKIFFGKSKYTIAYDYLVQAEKRALKNEYFDLLDLIYSDLIKLSQESVEFNPIEYIEKRKQNHVKLHALQEIDDLLAALVYRIKVSQNYSQTNLQFTELLQKTVNEFLNNEEIKKSSTLQLKIYHSLSRILLERRDYVSLEDYLKLTYRDFQNRGLFSKANHDSKLQMLTYLVNALFKNHKIDESLKATEELHKAMQEFDGLLFDKYLFYYYNSLVINYQVTDKIKAIEVLQEAKTKKEIKELSFYTIFVHLNLAVLYFDTLDFKNARKNLAKLKISDSFSKMDQVFQMKVNIVELLTFYEIGDIDLFDYQLNIIQKDYASILKDVTYKRDALFLEFVAKMDGWAKDKTKKEYDKFIKATQETESSESDIIDYREWLKGKC